MMTAGYPSLRFLRDLCSEALRLTNIFPVFSGCSQGQIEDQAITIAQTSYWPTLANSRQGKIASASPHCCGTVPSEGKAQAAADESGLPSSQASLSRGRTEAGLESTGGRLGDKLHSSGPKSEDHNAGNGLSAPNLTGAKVVKASVQSDSKRADSNCTETPLVCSAREMMQNLNEVN